MIVDLETANLQNEMDSCINIPELHKLLEKYQAQEKYELCAIIQMEVQKRLNYE